MPPVNSTAISAWEPGLPWKRYLGVIGKTPRSIAMRCPRSESMYSMNHGARVGLQPRPTLLVAVTREDPLVGRVAAGGACRRALRNVALQPGMQQVIPV